MVSTVLFYSNKLLPWQRKHFRWNCCSHRYRMAVPCRDVMPSASNKSREKRCYQCKGSYTINWNSIRNLRRYFYSPSPSLSLSLSPSLSLSLSLVTYVISFPQVDRDVFLNFLLKSLILSHARTHARTHTQARPAHTHAHAHFGKRHNNSLIYNMSHNFTRFLCQWAEYLIILMSFIALSASTKHM